MKSLCDAARLDEVKSRTAQLTQQSKPLWGTMTVSQAVAHCAIGMEVALGDRKPPRMFLGRILGPIVKPMAFKDDAPMKKNSPTAPSFVVKHEPLLDVEKDRLLGLLNRFEAVGAGGCTTHPHVFFGSLTPDQWAVLMYKHMDHHLRQFGV